MAAEFYYLSFSQGPFARLPRVPAAIDIVGLGTVRIHLEQATDREADSDQLISLEG